MITSRPRSARARSESIVEFTCVATGHPYPDLTWWNNNRLVSTGGGGGARVSVSNGGQHLRIEDVRAYDAGRYVCRARNRLGTDEAEATLEVVPNRDPLGRGFTSR